MLLTVFTLIAVAVIAWWFIGEFEGPAKAIPILVPFAMCSILFIPMYFGAKDGMGGDKMVLNGVVVSKAQERTSCSHSYSCNCRVVTSGKTSSTKCDTCYEHPYDYNWVVKSNVGSASIARVDRRGSEEPPRFTKAYVGEPFSIELSYFNYIKASPLSIFKDYNAYEKVLVPSYPKPYDYYRVKHTVNWKSQYTSGIQSVDQMLTEKLKLSSSKAKANVVVVFYGGSDDLVEAMRVKNFGGRINDLTILIKADSAGNIQNVGVFSWSKSDLVNVTIRDEISELNVLNEENNKKLVDIIDHNLVTLYKKRSNEEFAYLEENISMPMWVYVIGFLWMCAIIGAGYYLKRKG